MNKEILTHFWRTKNIKEELIQAFDQIPRENFVKPGMKHLAYADQPLPTIRNQSISQPTTVMIMLQALEIKEGDKVLEIGAGAGYQAALLSVLVGEKGKVITTEVIPELVQMSRQNLANLGLTNVTILETNGSEGYPQKSPFDKIILTAACPTIPQPLIDQLKEGGLVIAPVGDLESQTMVRGTKVSGKLELEFMGQFMFVPLQGKHGFKEEEMVYR